MAKTIDNNINQLESNINQLADSAELKIVDLYNSKLSSIKLSDKINANNLIRLGILNQGEVLVLNSQFLSVLNQNNKFDNIKRDMFQFARTKYPGQPLKGIIELSEIGYEKLSDLLIYFNLLKPLLENEIITFKDFTFINSVEINRFLTEVKLLHNFVIDIKNLSFINLLLISTCWQSIEQYVNEPSNNINNSQKNEFNLLKAILHDDNKELNTHKEQGDILNKEQLQLLCIIYRCNPLNFSVNNILKSHSEFINDQELINSIYEMLFLHSQTNDEKAYSLVEFLAIDRNFFEMIEALISHKDFTLLYAVMTRNLDILSKYLYAGNQLINQFEEILLEQIYTETEIKLSPVIANLLPLHSPIFDNPKLKIDKDFIREMLRLNNQVLGYEIILGSDKLISYESKNLKLSYGLAEFLWKQYLKNNNIFNLANFIPFISAENFKINEELLNQLLRKAQILPNKIEILEKIFAHLSPSLTLTLSDMMKITNNDMDVAREYIKLIYYHPRHLYDLANVLSKNLEFKDILIESGKISLQSVAMIQHCAFNYIISSEDFDNIYSHLHSLVSVNAENKAEGSAPLNVIIHKILQLEKEQIGSKNTENKAVYIDMLKLLLNHNDIITDIDYCSGGRRIPILTKLITEGHNEVAKLLLDHPNTSINNLDINNHPLAIAIKYKNQNMIEAIINNSNFNYNYKNDKGELVIDKILEKVNPEIKNFIIAALVKSDIRDSQEAHFKVIINEDIISINSLNSTNKVIKDNEKEVQIIGDSSEELL